VELALQTPLAEVADLMSEIEALVRPARKGLPPCEIVQLRVETSQDLEACIAVAQELRAHGLAVPLAVQVSPTLPGLTRLLPYVAKLNIRAALDAQDANGVEQLGALVDTAKAAGCAIQWDVCPAALSSPSIGESENGGRASPPLAAGESWHEGGSIEKLADTALALARLCQAHTFESCLIALEGAPIIPAYRLLAARLAAAELDTPCMLKTPRLCVDDALLRASLTLGSLLCDGFVDAIEVVSYLPSHDALRLSYNILQGARRRISKTEFISCPSCGRTQFDLETTTQRIKSQTSHLTGVKIAIMGCIVNGPGEMADADFGYVGAGPDKINLYVGKECVERHISFDLADQKLIELIKAHGKWIDPA